MLATPQMDPAIRLLEAKHPDLDIRGAIQRLHANDFAALVLQELVALVPSRDT